MSKTRTCPAVGAIKPSMILMKVDLPAPLAPTSPMIPGSTATVRSCRAVTRVPYVLVNPWVTMRLTVDSLGTPVTDADQVNPGITPEPQIDPEHSQIRHDASTRQGGHRSSLSCQPPGRRVGGALSG